MKKIMLAMVLISALTLGTLSSVARPGQNGDLWPDGTPIDEWFADTTKVDVNSLGRKYVLTDYGVISDSTVLQTETIQKVIDLAAENGGGVIVIPRGTFLSGALFFRQGTHLNIESGGVLKGIDAIKYYPVLKTRMEGQTIDYFAALVNADSIDGFTISGKGTINGNGLRFWEEFWIRRKYNPQCTNLEALRPRLVYISNCRNVTVQDVSLVNSPFWTNHIYKSERVKYLGCTIYAPHEPKESKAPSSDAIDLDVCRDVLIRGCNISVNDDAVVLKGGKGTWADKDSTNGPNSNIIIENCNYGFVHGCLTLGSESLYDRNVILRNSTVNYAARVLWLKMRPDTPQHYEYVMVDNVSGTCGSFLVVRPWTQFFNPEKREDMPLSRCNDIMIRNIDIECDNFFNVGLSDKYKLADFFFENVKAVDKADSFDKTLIENTVLRDVIINGVKR